MDVQSRRALLTCDSNPNDRSDYLISLGDRLMMRDHGTFDVRVTYVPDSFILNVTSFHSYLMALGDPTEMTPERSGKLFWKMSITSLYPDGSGSPSLDDRRPQLVVLTAVSFKTVSPTGQIRRLQRRSLNLKLPRL